MRRTFLGGVRIDSRKITAKLPSEEIKQPEYIAIPMQQHIGAPCVRLVEIGDSVSIGQMIGNNKAALCCPVHSSVSGVVERIENRLMHNGSSVEHVVIKNDFKNTVYEKLTPHSKKITETEPDEIIEKIRDAGIVGMGGASFPTYAKLKSSIGKVETIIINCAECEPYITSNHRLLLEKPEDVIGGIKILMYAAGVNKAVIAIEDNKLNAAYKLAEFLGDDSMISIEALKTKYPQGDERQLIYALYGVELRAGQLPADIGFVVFNPESCAAIFNAFATGMPLVKKYVTVSGECIKEPKNLIVPVGISLRDCIDFCGGFSDGCEKIVTGGPMMGASQWDLDSVIQKGTGAILALPSEKSSTPHCIRCGRCARSCQMHLLPLSLAYYSEHGDYESCEELGVMSCVECGCCTYVCPGKVPIVQHIRNAKQELKSKASLKK